MVPTARRSTAVALASSALTALILAPSCDARAAAEDCETLSTVELRDNQGHVFYLRHTRCGFDDEVDICDRDRCLPDRCAPAGITAPDDSARDPALVPIRDGWLEPLLPLARRDGAQDVLLVRRLGNGGYPWIVRYAISGGRPVCANVTDVDAMVGAAAGSLHRYESFGFRGGRVEAIAGRLVLTHGIYLPEDANCCPSGGFARIWARFAADELELELEQVERLAPDSHGSPPETEPMAASFE